MKADAMLVMVVLQGLVHESQRSLCIKLCCICERNRSRKLTDKAVLLLLVSHNQQCILMMYDNKHLTGEDAWFYLVLSQTNLLKLTGQ